MYVKNLLRIFMRPKSSLNWENIHWTKGEVKAVLPPQVESLISIHLIFNVGI